MPIYEIMRLRETYSDETKMSIQLALHCAPTIRGSKAANIVTLKRDDSYDFESLFEGTKISYRFLKSGRNRTILYLYRKEELEEYLFSKEVEMFLKTYGYSGKNIDEMLDILSEKIQIFENGETEFPHEIGVFLEYPVKDVKSYLENDGKNFAYLGYWKVYHNVQKTKKLFKRYDEEKELAVREIMLGKSISEIAV